jgi:predicted dehydrogenase
VCWKTYLNIPTPATEIEANFKVNKMELKVGVLGTANIARKNIIAMNLAEHCNCVAVGSRSADKAAKYAQENNVPNHFGTYDEVLQDETVNAVYIPLPTTTHLEWVSKAAAQGKHILCEKPVGCSTAELVEMLRIAKEANIVFMDGVMFMHNTRLKHLRNSMYEKNSIFNNGNNAGPLQINSNFSFKGDESFFQNNIRCKAAGDPLGCIGDLGWYNVRFSLFVFHYEMPKSVRCVIHQASSEGVPYHASATMVWSSQHENNSSIPVADRCSNFTCSFLHAENQSATIIGENGFIELNDFVIPADPTKSSFNLIKHKWGSKAEKIDVQCNTVECQGEQTIQMWETFQQLVSNTIDTTSSADKQFYMEVALKTQMIVDALLESGRNDGAEVVLPTLPEW